MPPQKVFCRQCNDDHPRPVGRNCKRGRQVGDAIVTAVSVPGPSTSDNTASALSSSDANGSSLTNDIGGQILN